MRYKVILMFLMFFAVSLLQACDGTREASSIADAYDVATEKVLSAASSEELVEISYTLHLGLADYGKDSRTGSSRAVVAAKEKFEQAVKEKEIEFYTTSYKTKK